MSKASGFIALLAKLLFISPILLDLYLIIAQLSILFQWHDFFTGINLSVNYFFFALGATIFTYVFFILHILLGLFKSRNRFLDYFNKLYLNNRSIILTTIVLTGSTLTPFLITVLLPSFTPDLYKYLYYFDDGYAYFAIKLFLVLIMILGLKGSIPFKIVKISGSIFITSLLGVLIFLSGVIYDEFSPRHYFTFPLDDKAGRYLINYDGDYWLTLYEVQNFCNAESNGKAVCKEILIKKGNTSITETPVDLKQYIDVPIHVSGEFVKTYGPTYEGKQICVGEGFSKKCSESTGPGTWYASPLKIKAITLDK